MGKLEVNPEDPRNLASWAACVGAWVLDVEVLVAKIDRAHFRNGGPRWNVLSRGGIG